MLQSIVTSDSSSSGSCEKCHALGALLWLQQTAGGVPLVTPGGLLKNITQGEGGGGEGGKGEGGRIGAHYLQMSDSDIRLPHLPIPTLVCHAGGHTVLTVVRVLFADPWPEVGVGLGFRGRVPVRV